MRGILIILAIILLSGCTTHIPQAENFPEAKQKKAMAALHWQWIANDAVMRTLEQLQAKGYAKTQRLYVAEGSDTHFDRAFRHYLIAGFIEQGVSVSTQAQNALEVKYEAQVIKHAGAFDPERLGYKPGFATAGVTGFWVLRDILKSVNTANALASVGYAAGYDVYRASNPGETPIELVLTTSIVHRQDYVMMNADAYYLEHGEEWLFEGCKGANRRYCR